MFRAFNVLLSSIEKDFLGNQLHVVFLKDEVSWQFNKLFSVDGAYGMLRQKDFYSINIPLPLIWAFVDNTVEYT